MNFEELKNPELQEKLRSCQTVEELVQLAKEQGVEMSDEALESVAGGIDWSCGNLCFSNRQFN